jgi:hypothetical protein
MLGLSSRSDLLRDQDSVLFELFDLALEGRHHTGAGSFDSALYKRIHLLLDLRCLLAKLLARAARLRQAQFPGVLEHGTSKLEEPLSRLKRLQQAFEVFFEHVAADRFAVALTPFGLAQIVRMLLARLAC